MDSLAHRVRCATGASAYPMDKPYRRCGRARPAASPRPPSSRIPFNTEYRSPMAQPCSEAVLPPPSCPGQNWIGEPLWRGEALVLGEPKRPWPFSQPQPKRPWALPPLTPPRHHQRRKAGRLGASPPAAALRRLMPCVPVWRLL